MADREILLYKINELRTRSVFPKIYDGFTEIDELANGEDALLDTIRTLVVTALDDKVISTASPEKVSEFEENLYLSSIGLTMDERRQQILDYLNRSRVFNDKALSELVASMAGGRDTSIAIDHNSLTLGITVENDGDDGTLLSVWIVERILPRVPQNLSLYARVECGLNGAPVANHAGMCAISGSLAGVSYTYTPPEPTPVPPTPPAPTSIYIGSTTSCEAGTTTLYSPYFWMYGFQSTNGTNWYTPNYYQSATPPVTDSSLETVGGTRYLEVVLTDGAGGTFSPTTFRLAEWSSKPEFYMDSSYSSQDSNKNGAVVRFGSDVSTQKFNLPSDMYSISGTTITWDMSHPLMALLQGKECTTN